MQKNLYKIPDHPKKKIEILKFKNLLKSDFFRNSLLVNRSSIFHLYPVYKLNKKTYFVCLQQTEFTFILVTI